MLNFLLVSLTSLFFAGAVDDITETLRGSEDPVYATKPLDFYKTHKVKMRNEWAKIAPKMKDHDDCYKYFELDKGKYTIGKESSAKKRKDYLEKLKRFYQGGRLILHHTVVKSKPGVDVGQSMVKTHVKKKWGDIGYHFYITNKDCNIREGRPLHIMPIAAGHMPSRVGDCIHRRKKNKKEKSYDLSNDFDFKSINIAWEGNSTEEKPSKACKKKISSFLQGLATSLGVRKLGGHGHYNLIPKDCPGHHLADFLRKGNFGSLKVEGHGILKRGTKGKKIPTISEVIKRANPKLAPGFDAMRTQFKNKIGLSKAMSLALNGQKIPPKTLIVNDVSESSKDCADCDCGACKRLSKKKK